MQHTLQQGVLAARPTRAVRQQAVLVSDKVEEVHLEVGEVEEAGLPVQRAPLDVAAVVELEAGGRLRAVRVQQLEDCAGGLGIRHQGEEHRRSRRTR